MHLARRPRTQRRLDPSLDTPHADTLHRRAVDLHRFSDLVVGQTRTIDAFVCLQEDARVHQGPRRSFAFRHQRLQLGPLFGRQFDPVHLHGTALYRKPPTGRSCHDDPLADQVRRQVTTGMDEVKAAGCERCHWEHLLAAIEAYARIGRHQEAHEFALEWDAHYPNPHPWYRFLRQYAGALLVAHSGGFSSAIPLFEAARVEAERMSASLEALWVTIDMGEALATVDRERAITILQGAAAVAQALGSGSARERADAALRSFGVRTWRRTADPREGPLLELSPRERVILRLVTEGASNPEIASAVFLSRKTVERHVSNILRKVGVRNRTELASAVGPQMRDLTDDSSLAPLVG